MTQLPTDAAELLQLADQLFNEADQALADGDLGTYQKKIDEARQRVADAVDILGLGSTVAPSDGSVPGTTPDTVPGG